MRFLLARHKNNRPDETMCRMQVPVCRFHVPRNTVFTARTPDEHQIPGGTLATIPTRRSISRRCTRISHLWIPFAYADRPLGEIVFRTPRAKNPNVFPSIGDPAVERTPARTHPGSTRRHGPSTWRHIEKLALSGTGTIPLASAWLYPVRVVTVCRRWP